MAAWRIRPRFSLRTLLVALTLVGVWLGYHFNWIRQRHAALVFEGRVEASLVTPTGPKTVIITNQAPWPLNWMGEPGHTALIVGGRTEPAEVERIRKLFPEADVDAIDTGLPQYEDWAMRLLRQNRRVFDLDDAHPAKRLLITLSQCKVSCAELVVDALKQNSIDPPWQSAIDGRKWTLTTMVDELSTDVELDGFLISAPQWTESERKSLDQLPRYRALVAECAQAARQAGNSDCLELVDEVVDMLKLWDEYLEFRRQSVEGKGLLK